MNALGGKELLQEINVKTLSLAGEERCTYGEGRGAPGLGSISRCHPAPMAPNMLLYLESH